jgi:hypothetical protein
MKELTINFRGGGKRGKSIGVSVPETWNELSKKQLEDITRVLNTDLPKISTRCYILKSLLGVKNSIFFSLQDYDIACLLYLTNFIFKDCTLTKNNLPIIRFGFLGLNKLAGPTDDFSNIRFKEFMFADTFLGKSARAKDEKTKKFFLDKFIACLYRPIDKQAEPGDLREKFNEHIVDKRAKQISKLSPIKKQMIVTWYKGCRAHLENLNQEVFREDPEAKKKKGGTWGDVLLSLPNDKFGTINQAADEFIHTIFRYMNNQLKEARTQKK